MGIENIETSGGTRNRRDTDNSVAAGETVTYKICVRLVGEISVTVSTLCLCVWMFSALLCSHSVHRNLSGMAIADITLLSGFEVETQDMDKVAGLRLFLLLWILKCDRIVMRYDGT